LRAIVLRKLGREAEADQQLRSTLELDPLDAWARHLLGEELSCDTQTRFDLALDFARAGFFPEAIRLLEKAGMKPDPGTAPLSAYYLGWLHGRAGDAAAELRWFKEAAKRAPDYCFPARLEEIAILETAFRLNPRDARAAYHLGNLLYDKKRHAEAVRYWEQSAKLDPAFSIVWRNLGIGYFNVGRKPARARAVYEKAFRTNPGESRLLYERDQLWKRLRVSPRRRLRELEKHRRLVDERDDLSVELCALYNQTGQPARAREIISTRKFQPWEGGEGLALGQHVRTHLSLARLAAQRGDLPSARTHLEKALVSPPNLGEARHLLANQSDIHYRLGQIHDALGDKAKAGEHWNRAAHFRGDFQGMSVRLFSEMTYFSALALKSLGKKAAAEKLLRQLLAYAKKLEKAEAKIDYFATSLPTMLLFEEDIQFRQQTSALFLQAQAYLGLGNRRRAGTLLDTVLRRDPGHAFAADLRAELKSLPPK
jgi:tetratricopeptide (TPR) repeat protein